MENQYECKNKQVAQPENIKFQSNSNNKMCTFFDDFAENHLSEGDGSGLTALLQITQTWNLKRREERN